MKKHLAIVCPTGNFGGMELDSIKLAKKLHPYCNIVFITKKDGFLDKNFNSYILKEASVNLETFEKNSFLFFKNIFNMKNL